MLLTDMICHNDAPQVCPLQAMQAQHTHTHKLTCSVLCDDDCCDNYYFDHDYDSTTTE